MTTTTDSASKIRASLAKDLYALALAAWQQQDPNAEVYPSLFTGSAEAIAESQRIGNAANELGGLASMRAVANAAFCERSPFEFRLVLGIEYTAKDEMCSVACSQLNGAWHGIGDWRA